MSERIPEWLAPPPAPSPPAWLAPPRQAGLPEWLSTAPKRELSPPVPMGKSAAQKALIFQQFEAFFPRLMDMVTAGFPLSRAVQSLPVAIDTGAFVRWLYKDSERTAIYEEAKKYRTEVWAGELIKHATADEDNENSTYTHDTSRSRLIVDTYKFLMGADNRKQYGDTKTIDVNQTVSVKLALEKADNRLLNIIDLTDDDVEVIPVSDYKRLSEPSGPAWEDGDD